MKLRLCFTLLLFTIAPSYGQWLKLAIDKSGVYELKASDIRKAGIDLNTLNAENIQFFTTQPTELPQEATATELRQEWVEIPSYYIGPTNKFSGKSSFWFYAEGPIAQLNKPQAHHYSLYNYVFVNLGGKKGKRIPSDNSQRTNPTEINTLDFQYYDENEIYNLVSSGREWYGDFINTNYKLNLNLEDYIEGSQVALKVSMLSTAKSEKAMDLHIDEEKLGTLSLPTSSHDKNDRFRRYNRIGNEVSDTFFFLPSSDKPQLHFTMLNADSFQDGAYLNSYELNYTRKITTKLKSQWIGTLGFDKPHAWYRLVSDKNIVMWNVTDPLRPELLEQGMVNKTKEIIRVSVFDNTKLHRPALVTPHELTDLSYAEIDYLIIHPKAFAPAAQTLAQYRYHEDTLSSKAVKVQSIYDHYSGGKVDPTALRNYFREVWNRNNKTLKYVLLMADASYDYKNNQNLRFVKTENLIPTYQSRESLEPIYSFSSDDYFGFLDSNEGYWPEGTSSFNTWESTNDTSHLLDIAIGRVPAKDLLEAFNYVDKVKSYEQSNYHRWRQKVLFVADDEDFNIHLRDAERFSSQISQKKPSLKIEKLYLDAYPQTLLDNRKVSLEAQNLLTQKVNEGVFIINYNGHGSEQGWTDEKLLTLNQIQTWNNQKRLPIFFTATCEYGKYDNPLQVSGAEVSLLQPLHGAIALLTTTRPVFASTNFVINKAFYDELYTSQKDRLGDIFKRTKNTSIRGEINRNFTLLGDPALRIPRISEQISIDSVKNQTHELKWPLGSKTQISGSIRKDNFNGKLWVSIFAAEDLKKTLGDGANPAPYQEHETKVYEGVHKVQNSLFNFDFRVPYISADSSRTGKILLYALSNDSTQEYSGYFDQFKIIDAPENTVTDQEGPRVMVLSENTRELILQFVDSSGINPNSLHITINDTLVYTGADKLYSPNSFQSSIYQNILSSLPTGQHKIEVTIKDVYNNETREAFLYSVNEISIKLEHVTVYPNPTNELLRVKVIHSASGENLKLRLNIFDMNGLKILSQERDCYICNKTIEAGTNLGGKISTNGTYIYQVVVTDLINGTRNALAGTFLFWQ